MSFIAWYAIGSSTLALLVSPWLFGRQITIKEPYMVARMVHFVMISALSGRVLGWW